MSWAFWIYAAIAFLSALGYSYRVDQGARVVDRDDKLVHTYSPTGLVLHIAVQLFVLYLVANL